jgi:uncharacterized membrane protein
MHRHRREDRSLVLEASSFRGQFVSLNYLGVVLALAAKYAAAIAREEMRLRMLRSSIEISPEPTIVPQSTVPFRG